MHASTWAAVYGWRPGPRSRPPSLVAHSPSAVGTLPKEVVAMNSASSSMLNLPNSAVGSVASTMPRWRKIPL